MLGRIPALTLDQAHREALAEGTLGGITLFRENACDLKQLAALTGEIINASYHSPILAVDQEGGAVQRFDQVLSPLPSPMALAALDNCPGNDLVIETITGISCRQLKRLGINMLLAPTLDLQTNAKNPIICTRAYGDDGEKVTSIGSRVVAAIAAQGLVAVAKHFPGHGSCAEDSHLQLALVDKSEASLLASDVVPFAKLAHQLKAILIGHIWMPQLVQNECPATLSQTIVTGLLRQKLGFNGLIVSDDMIMKAITQGFGLGEACVQAVLAGVDLLLVCGTIEESMEAVEAIAQATECGRVSQERLDQAAGKIDALIKTKPTYLDAGSEVELLRFSQAIDLDSLVSRNCSARAIAILRGSMDQQTITCLTTAKRVTVIAPAHPRYPIALAADLRLLLADAVAISDIRYAVNPGPQDQGHVLQEMEESDIVIYLTYRSAINIGQVDLGRSLLTAIKTPSRLIHVACDSPYDLAQFEGLDISTSLASFDASCQAMSALATVLVGAVRAVGKCPVKL